MKPSIFLCLFVLFLSCGPDVINTPGETTVDQPPSWAKDAIWYQIFVERFRNGDRANDPRIEDVQPGFPDEYPSSWTVTDWDWDWYQRENWMKDMADTSFNREIQMRRFGGDLQGVLEQIDYLKDLGVNAIYFNPLNDAPTLHKYDARHFHHIDRNLGPDPVGDAELMTNENHANPEDWNWTAADQLFLELVDSLHRSGIRVIMDYSWNHTGMDFWALHDVRERGEESPYYNWYEIESLDDPNTPEDEFEYEGWFGIKTLPVLAEENEPLQGYDYQDGDIHPLTGGFESDQVVEHIFAVSQRWLDPNGDGDPSDGVDGFRLDVAAEVGLDFWRDYRQFVKGINPEAFLVGEVWWQRWPGVLMDPSVYLQGDVFDAVMNYRWYKLARGTIAGRNTLVPIENYQQAWDSLQQGIPTSFQYSMMNMSASHDSPRLSTSLLNDCPYKACESPESNPDFKIYKGDQANFMLRQLPLLVHQFSWVGGPQIYYGDEIGMWGADDPHCRKPMAWPETEPHIESTDFLGGSKQTDTLWFNTWVTDYYRLLAQMRNEHSALRNGELIWPENSDANLLQYVRRNDEEEILCVFNPSEATVNWSVPAGYKVLLGIGNKSGYQLADDTPTPLSIFEQGDGGTMLHPGSFSILQKISASQ